MDENINKNKPSKLQIYSKKQGKKSVKKTLVLEFDADTGEMVNELQKSMDFNRFVVDAILAFGAKKIYKELKNTQKGE